MPDFSAHDFSPVDFSTDSLTTSDFVKRIDSLIPFSWFNDGPTPVKDTLLTGIATNLSWAYSFYLYALWQSRISSASGVWLDRVAWDFFRGNFKRRSSEDDSKFRPRLLKEILRKRLTRTAILQMLLDMLGVDSKIYEPWSPKDVGSYGTGTCGYGMGLGYGSLSFPYQIFVDVVRPPGSGIPLISGYGGNLGGYGVGATAYVDINQVVGITDAEIYAAVAGIVAAGVTAWVTILGIPVPKSFVAYPGGPTIQTQPGVDLRSQ